MSHLYVIQFSTGAIKVGRSETPKARIRQHLERVACVGVHIKSSCIFECTGDPKASEAALIERCNAELSAAGIKLPNIVGSEWFCSHLDYDRVAAWAHEIAESSIKAPVKPEPKVFEFSGTEDQRMTRAELGEALKCFHASDVAKFAGISTKTVYRMRLDPGYMPNLTTFMSLEAAVKSLTKPKRSKVAA